jgi:hypothetical protein
LEGKGKEQTFLDALANNTSITSVILKSDFLACLRGDVRSQVLKAVGKLPNIQSITLGNSLVLAPDLTELVTQAKTLTSLTLEDVCLQGEPELVSKLEASLSSHGALKEFNLLNCMASNQEVNLDELKSVKDGSGGCGTPVHPAAKLSLATAA